MKNIFGLITFFLAFPAYAAMTGILQPSNQEQAGIPPNGVIQYDRDCTGLGKPKGLPTTIDSSVAGTVTITETCAAANGCPITKVWVSTIVTVGAVVTPSCAALQ